MAAFSSLAALAMGASTIFAAVQGKRALDQQEDAQKQNLAAAKKTADLADQANNKANAKMPNLGSLLTGNMDAAGKGLASTLLTGPNGIESSKLQLGKTTLLGS